MLNNHVTSKAEIAKELNLSMPTVLANVNDLLEKGVLEETGEYASTGGRKAKSIGINKSYCHAMGILIDRKSTRLNSSHRSLSRMPSSA